MPEVSRLLSLAPGQILRLAAPPRASLHLQVRQGRLALLRPAWLALPLVQLRDGEGWTLAAGEGSLWLHAAAPGAELLLWCDTRPGLLKRARFALAAAWQGLSVPPLSATRTSRTD